MNSEIENIDDEDDVLIRMQHDNGTVVTFVSAPSAVFKKTDTIDSMTFWLAPDNVFVAINEDLLDEMIEESIKKNSGIYGDKEAAFLPIVHVLNIGLKEVDRQITQRREKNES